MFTRRQLAHELARVLAAFGLGAKALAAPARKRYTPPPVMRFENQSGEVWVPGPEHFQNGTRPEGFDHMFTQFPNELRETWYNRDEQIGASCSGWSEDLVLAMANDGYKLGEAILIVANLCERCTNAACFDYGLNEGPAYDTEAYRANHTRCEFCETPDERRRRLCSDYPDERHEAVSYVEASTGRVTL